MAERIIDYLCKSKKKGHRCVLEQNHKGTEHVCMCKEKWEEVKT